MSSISERVKQARNDAGLSQTEVASRMILAGHTNYNQNAVSRIEAGTQRVTLDAAQDLAEALEAPFAWIATGAEWSRDLYQAGVRDGITKARDAIASI